MNGSPKQENRSGFRRLLDARIIQTLAIYIPVAWVVTEIITAATPQFGLPDWVPGLAMVLLISGIPVVAFLALAFQITGEGVRTEVRSVRGGLVIAIALAVLTGTGVVLFQRLEPPGPGSPAGGRTAGPGETEAVASVSVFEFEAPEDSALGSVFAGEISQRLARHADLYVTAPESILSYVTAGVGPSSQKELLLTDYGVRGRLFTEADSWRLEVELLDANQQSVFEESFTFGNDAESRQGLQRRVSQRLAERLGTRTPSAEYCEPSGDLTAMEHYHRSRLLINRKGPENLAESERLLKEAIERDPDYGQAYSALAITYMLQRGRPDVQKTSLVQEVARKALDRCPTLGAAYYLWVPPYEGVTNRIINEQLQWLDALAMEPNHLWLLDNYAFWLEYQGRMDEAAKISERAFRNNPLDPRAVVSHGWSQSFQGNYDVARRMADRALELGDDDCNSPMLKLHIAVQTGDAEQSRRAWDALPVQCLRQLDVWADYPHGSFADDMAEARNDPAKRRRLLDHMAANLERDANMAMIQGIELGDPELAHRALAFLLENGGYIHQSAWWMPSDGARLFRRDPRFVGLMEVLGMDQYWREFGWPSRGMCAPLGDGFVCDN